MKKYFVLILFVFLIFVSGCTQKFYLDQEYYKTDGDFVHITSDMFEKIDFQNYVLFVYNNYCAFSVPCDEIFKEFMEQNNVNFLSMSYEEFKKTNLHETVKFAPSVIIVKDWKIVTYLDPEKDKYLDMYQSVEEFWKWISEYVNFDVESIGW